MTARPLVGRDSALARAALMVDRLPRAGGMLLVTGEAGIGKTTLCEAIAANAASRGHAVAFVGCWEAAGWPPLEPWAQIHDQLGLDRAQLFGANPFAELAADERDHRFAAAIRGLRDSARHRAALVVIDDLHWADIASLRFLAMLAPQLVTMPLVVVAARRDEEPTADTAGAALVAGIARSAERVALTGLTADGVAALVVSVAGRALEPAAVSALHEHTRGNPLFVSELARELDPSQPAVAGAASVPDSVSAVFRARLGRVSPACRAVIEATAVAGDVVEVGVLQRVLDEEDRLLDRLDEATQAGLLVARGSNRFACAHPILRATVIQDLGIARRVRLHTRVADALDASLAAGGTVDPEALAYHALEAAAAGGATRAVERAVGAGCHARASGAFEAAAGWFEAALSAMALTGSAERRGEVLLLAGEAWHAAGDRDRARRAYRDAATQARLAGRPELLASAALALAPGGGFEVELFDDEQERLLEEALDRLPPAATAARARCLARLSVARSLGDDIGRRVAMSDHAVALARAGGHHAALAEALAAHCDAHAGPADAGLRLAASQEIIELARTAGDQPAELLGRRLRIVALLEVGDVLAADQEVARYEVTANAVAHPAFRWYVPLWRGMRALSRGRLADQRALLAQTRAGGSAAASPNTEMLAMTQEMFAALETQPAAMQTALAWLESDDTFRMYGAQVVGSVALGLLAAGRAAEANAFLERRSEDVRTAPVDSEWLPMLVQVADAVGQLGGHPIAGWLYETLLPYESMFAVEGIGAMLHGAVARHLGVLASVTGRPDAARAHFERALEINRGADAALLVARTLRDAGVFLGDRSLLDAARRRYQEIDVPARVAELDELLAGSAPASEAPRHNHQPGFIARGESWTLRWDGVAVELRDAKGLQDLARLLRRPGRAIAALDLYTEVRRDPAARGASDRAAPGDLGPQIDATARRAYRQRLVELEEDLNRADEQGDIAASARLAAERDLLVEQLTAAYGLGGRARRTGSAAERARTAVTARIKDSLRRIELVHPDAGRHLRRAVRTGTFCVYDPDGPIDWEL